MLKKLLKLNVGKKLKMFKKWFESMLKKWFGAFGLHSFSRDHFYDL
jgi:hypothetical protein